MLRFFQEERFLLVTAFQRARIVLLLPEMRYFDSEILSYHRIPEKRLLKLKRKKYLQPRLES
jgi:hypothetical protein